MTDRKMWDEWIEMLLDLIRTGKDPDETAKRVSVLGTWGLLAARLNDLMPGCTIDGVRVVKIILKEDMRRAGHAMLIVTGIRKKEKLVTFHSGLGTSELWHTFWQRAEAGSLEWKIDTPPGQTFSQAVEESLPAMPWQ